MHYSEHKKAVFFRRLVDFMTSGPVIAMVLEGVEAVQVVRKICGATYPADAEPGTIRGDFCHISKSYTTSNSIVVPNAVHSSSDKESAKKEIKLWFGKEKIRHYKRTDQSFLI